jgi:CHASE2 domain-containing sensor protein
MSDNELLLALSDMMDKKIEPLKSDMRDIKITLENDILPRLQNIESCYTTTYKRYQAGVNQIEAMQADIGIMKKVIAEHSQKLQAFV